MGDTTETSRGNIWYQEYMSLKSERDQLRMELDSLMESANVQHGKLKTTTETLWEIYRGANGGTSAWSFSRDALVEIGEIEEVK